MTRSTDRGKKYGLTVISTLVNGSEGSDMEKEISRGPMGTLMLESGRIASSMDRVRLPMLMAINTKESSRIASSMESER